ncbi:sulfotransferase family protein [Adhaeretor mobilis]|uniref:Sulfotransferase domain protein n=1 Tax=Adhaeretor mobilis TaxID=1930276 RepID=A0A517MRX4_9BACT|nr:sulfotransferase [Adhaeretor mobilis]QDS97527.1 Sulfotransferase domain protein [Adhaeretor mobilis]
MLPQFVVIGAQKAGSTFLLECLEEHPEIFMPPYEVAFFDGELYDPANLGKFERHFQSAQPGQLIGMKRPNLLGLADCPERLHRHFPDAKLIAILRHPIDRAVSAYFHYMKTGFLPIVPVETGLAKILAGEYDQYPRAAEVLTFGLYAKHLAAYDQCFQPEQMQVILLDEVKRDAQGVLSRLYEFLHVRSDFQPTSQRRRPMAASYSLTRLKLWESVDRWLRVSLHGGSFFERRSGLLAKLAYRTNVLIDRTLWAKLFPAKAPQLSSELREKLKDYYRADVRRLEKRLGTKIPAWDDSNDYEKPLGTDASAESSIN